MTTSDSSGLCWISFDSTRPLVLCYAVSETVGNLMVEQSRLAVVEHVGSSELTSIQHSLQLVCRDRNEKNVAVVDLTCRECMHKCRC